MLAIDVCTLQLRKITWHYQLIVPRRIPEKFCLRNTSSRWGLCRQRLPGSLESQPTGLNELVNGKRGITADTAPRLAQRFKTSAEFWMNLQSAYELTEARAAMITRG
jgi:antitoxin HigA-1